jgi:hypothetical protein
VFNHVSGDGAGVGVVAAAGGLPDDEADDLILVKVLGERGAGKPQQRKCGKKPELE